MRKQGIEVASYNVLLSHLHAREYIANGIILCCRIYLSLADFLPNPEILGEIFGEKEEEVLIIAAKNSKISNHNCGKLVFSNSENFSRKIFGEKEKEVAGHCS